MKRFYSCNLFFIISPLFIFGQESDLMPISDATSIINKLNNRAKEITTFQSDFKQQKYLSYLDATVESQGKFTLKKNNRIRWEYIKPNPFIIIINDGKVAFKTQNQNPGAIPKDNKLMDQLNALVKSTFSGNLGQDDNFSLSLFENTSIYRVDLFPKDIEMKKLFKKIRIDFNKESLDIIGLKIVELSGDFTSLTFDNQILNRNISDSEFQIH